MNQTDLLLLVDRMATARSKRERQTCRCEVVDGIRHLLADQRADAAFEAITLIRDRYSNAGLHLPRDEFDEEEEPTEEEWRACR